MKIIYDPSKYHKFAFEYEWSMDTLEFCRWLKEDVGWKNFGYFEKKWRFSDVSIIDKIKTKYPNIEIDTSMDSVVRSLDLEKQADQLIVENANALKKKTDSDIQITGIKGELKPYQKVGVEFFMNNKGRAILGDTMGLGKTLQSLAYVVQSKSIKTLVISPSSVKYAWVNETEKWTKLKPFVFSSKVKKDLNELLKIIDNYDVFIINYDILKSFYKVLINIRWDLLILDEFHYIKNNSAQRTKIVKDIAKRIPSRILLSGTPLLSRPVELFNGLQLMDPIVWNNWYDFTKKYCQGHHGQWGWDARGASNISELQSRISRYFLRRTKEDVLPELPPKNFIDLPVELDSESKFSYELAVSSFIEYLKEVKDKNDKEIKKTLQAEKLVRLGELRKLASQGKVKMAEEVISNIIDSGEKVVVFSCYNEPLEYLQEKFKDKSVMLTGKTPELIRQKTIDLFQTDDKVQIFLGGMKSAGVGITLTAASNVLFIDYSFVPADHKQSADRIHRIGQTAESINIYQLYAKDTIDEKMVEMLANKQEIFDQLFEEGGAKKKTSGSIVNDLIKDFER